MVRFPASHYADWRSSALSASFLQETRDGAPGERLLQLIWQHQRLRREGLQTADGQSLRVLHPGFLNRSPGPDFRDAVVQFGEEPARTGDVEIDVLPRYWHQHQHAGNPRFQRVCLHVVWEAEVAGANTPPTLALKPRLDASVEELIAWMDLDPGLPDNVIGLCAAGFRRLPEAALDELLQSAACFRLQRKGMEFAARAREAGWEQALWEGLSGALGYRQNYWPMRRLAEERTRLLAGPAGSDRVRLQARLLGLSGLLPHDLASRPRRAAEYLRQIWDHWWRERTSYAALVFPRSIWALGGVRPANHPQRRLALLSHWWLREDLPARLEAWFAGATSTTGSSRTLLDCLQGSADAFWGCHWTLGSPALPRPQPLLGAARLTDLALNVVLPWFWVRAATGNNAVLQQRAENLFLAWPAAQDNAVLRLARLRLLAGRPEGFAWNASRQQGLLQLVRDFCGHSNALCDACALPACLATTHAKTE